KVRPLPRRRDLRLRESLHAIAPRCNVRFVDPGAVAQQLRYLPHGQPREVAEFETRTVAERQSLVPGHGADDCGAVRNSLTTVVARATPSWLGWREGQAADLVSPGDAVLMPTQFESPAAVGI